MGSTHFWSQLLVHVKEVWSCVCINRGQLSHYSMAKVALDTRIFTSTALHSMPTSTAFVDSVHTLQLGVPSICITWDAAHDCLSSCAVVWRGNVSSDPCQGHRLFLDGRSPLQWSNIFTLKDTFHMKHSVDESNASSLHFACFAFTHKPSWYKFKRPSFQCQSSFLELVLSNCKNYITISRK